MNDFFYDVLRTINGVGAAVVLLRMAVDWRTLRRYWTRKLKNYFLALAGAILALGGRGIESMIQGNEGGYFTLMCTLVIAWMLTAQWDGAPLEFFEDHWGDNPDFRSHYKEHEPKSPWIWWAEKSQGFRMAVIMIAPITMIAVAFLVHSLVLGGN